MGEGEGENSSDVSVAGEAWAILREVVGARGGGSGCGGADISPAWVARGARLCVDALSGRLALWFSLILSEGWVALPVLRISKILFDFLFVAFFVCPFVR